MWRGPYKVEGRTDAGNHLLKGVKGKGKGSLLTLIPPNQLTIYIAKSQNIPAKSNDEYASQSDDKMTTKARSLLLAPLMLIPYSMQILKMTKEFLVIQVFQFLVVQVVMRQLK